MPPPRQPGAGDALRRGVSTGTDNAVRVAPFSIVQLSGPEDWDPSSEKLPLTYRINDPNGRIQSGRLLYMVPADPTVEDDAAGQACVIHRQRLTCEALTHGDHELPASAQWDGNITEGLDDRIGEDVAADLAPIGVILEAWNTDQGEPGHVDGLESGATDGRGEYLARRLTEVPVDAIIEARWTTEWCIPYPQCESDELESERSKGTMDIRLRNVGDDVAVRIKVVRINDIDDPGIDMLASCTISSITRRATSARI